MPDFFSSSVETILSLLSACIFPVLFDGPASPKPAFSALYLPPSKWRIANDTLRHEGEAGFSSAGQCARRQVYHASSPSPNKTHLSFVPRNRSGGEFYEGHFRCILSDNLSIPGHVFHARLLRTVNSIHATERILITYWLERLFIPCELNSNERYLFSRTGVFA